MRKILTAILTFCFVILIFEFFTFNFAHAQQCTPPCSSGQVCQSGTCVTSFRIVPVCPADGCGWNEFVKMLDNFLQFSIIIAVPIAAILFAWAGFLYLSARGNPGQITKASNIFLSVVIGFIVVFCAWLIVDFILKGLTDPTGTGYIRLLE